MRLDGTTRVRRAARALVVLLLASTCAACGGDPSEGDGRATSGAGGSASSRSTPPPLKLVEVGRFDMPVHVLPVPGTDLVAVVQQGGRVVVASGMVCGTADSCPKRPVTRGTVVLDVSGDAAVGGEQGLLGMAFHPDWPEDPRIFIDYTDERGATRVEAWTLDSPLRRARRERVLLEIPQPFENHNGGHLEFGPDGLLYVATGDGGSAGDPGDRAQKPQELLGKLLRIDVDGGGERGFAIPPGNVDPTSPVWAVGLRNPWRFSFDADQGDLWIGDVGQNTWEEVDAVPRAALDGHGPNFGWRRREGFSNFDATGTTGPTPLVDPVLAYGRDDGCSVTGGVVYRGRIVPKLDGWYLFADYCADDLRLVRADGQPGAKRSQGDVEWRSVPGAKGIVSFGQVRHDEVLVVSLDGSIRQVLPA